MIDEIASFTNGDSSNPLAALHEFCNGQPQGTKLRYGQYLEWCTASRQEPVNEEAWYDLINESQVYTFTEDVDVDGVYWKAKHVVL